jgi:hypothetical protein
VKRLAALLTGGVLLLSGCAGEEGRRAQELLQQAEQAQKALRSATFEGSVGFDLDGQAVELRFDGAASPEGQAFSMRATGLPEAAGMEMRMVLRGGRAWLDDGSGWRATPLPAGATSMTGSMGAEAFQELARHVRDVRVAEGQVIAGVPTTTIAGEIDTAGMLKAMTQLGSLSDATGGGLSLDLDDLGLRLGDIEAVLSIDERTRLLTAARVTLELEAQGKKLSFDLRYRLTSANEPVELPAVTG